MECGDLAGRAAGGDAALTTRIDEAGSAIRIEFPEPLRDAVEAIGGVRLVGVPGSLRPQELGRLWSPLND